MRRRRRNSLLGVLLLTATAPSWPGWGQRAEPDAKASLTQTPAAGTDPRSGTGSGSVPDANALAQEAAARRQVDESERLRALQIDAQSAATEQAAEAMAEEKRLTADQSAALERLKHADAAVNEATQRLLDLHQRRADAQSRIDHMVSALAPVVPVILRMSTYPVETLLGAQVPAEDSVRGVLVMRAIAHQAEIDAHALIEDRAALESATRAAAEVTPQLAAARAARSAEADALAQQLAATVERRKIAEQDASDAARRAAAEAARAVSLRSMLEILETQRRLEEAQAREDELRAQREQKDAAAEAARVRQAAVSQPTGAGTLTADAKPAGQIVQPVAGTLVRSWGDPQDGEPATGQSWQTAPGARVVAPCNGTVAFAEPFRGYGLLLIIDCGGGYHAILAGLDQMQVGPGQAILGGDPVGTMQTPASAVQPGSHSGVAASDAAAAGARPEPALAARTGATSDPAGGTRSPQSPILYFELRKAGRPVNPIPWLKSSG
jgi:septal ring factor EnvC (AmiA/AmiB activator)